MYKVFAFLFLISLSSSAFSFADGCIKDIASVGLSTDSAAYQASESGSAAMVLSNFGFGVKASWIIFCPQKQIEYGTYLRVRKYDFSDSTTVDGYNNIPDEVTLISTGI